MHWATSFAASFHPSAGFVSGFHVHFEKPLGISGTVKCCRNIYALLYGRWPHNTSSEQASISGIRTQGLLSGRGQISLSLSRSVTLPAAAALLLISFNGDWPPPVRTERRREKALLPSESMASPRTITIVALSVALGLFFVFMGTIKLTPRLSKDAYNEMVSTAAAAMKGHRLSAGCISLPHNLAAGAAMQGSTCRGSAGSSCSGGREKGGERAAWS